MEYDWVFSFSRALFVWGLGGELGRGKRGWSIRV